MKRVLIVDLRIQSLLKKSGIDANIYCHLVVVCSLLAFSLKSEKKIGRMIGKLNSNVVNCKILRIERKPKETKQQCDYRTFHGQI
jgi:hypothetical protein